MQDSCYPVCASEVNTGHLALGYEGEVVPGQWENPHAGDLARHRVQ